MTPVTMTFTFPEPPSLNEMLDLAKKRDKRRRPIIYALTKDVYELRCRALMRTRPAKAWERWALTAAHFQLHNERDPIELLAGLKWPVDALVRWEVVAGDSPRHLFGTPQPTQTIDRTNRCVTLTLTRLP